MHLRRTTARLLRAALVPLVAVLALTGCTNPNAAAPSAPAAATSWTYTDDVGNTVTLDHVPSKISGFTDQVLSLMSYGVKPVATFGRTDVKTDTRFANYDMDGVAIVGNTYGEIDLEALASAQPDLIVTAAYPSDREGTIDTTQPYYGFKDLEQQKKLEAIAPIVTIKVGGAGLDVIKANTRLALALGADQAKVDEAQKAYEAAAANLTKVAGEKGLKVAAMYADADGVYLVKTADEPETQLYASLGVDYLSLNPGGNYYWDIYSWENAAKVKDVDLILLSNEGYQVADLRKQATFADSPALKAGQVFERRVSPLDYSSQARNLDTLAGQLSSAQKVTQ
jgi:iron complex transport system substrate-binding protein